MDLKLRYGTAVNEVETYTASENTFYQSPSVPKISLRYGTDATDIATYGIAETYTHPFNKAYTYSVYDVQGYNDYAVASWVESDQSIFEEEEVVNTDYINNHGFPCYGDPNAPAGAEYSLSGTAITTYDNNNKFRIRYGSGSNDVGMIATYTDTFTTYNAITTEPENAESCSSYATNRSYIPNFSNLEQPYTYLGLNHVVNNTVDGVSEYSTFTTGTQNVIEHVFTNYTVLYPEITVSFSRDHIGASNSGTVSYTIGYQPYLITDRVTYLSDVFRQNAMATLKYEDLPQEIRDDVEADKVLYYTLNQTLADSCVASDLHITGEQTWSSSVNITQWFPTGSTLFSFSHSLSDNTSIRSTWDLYYGMNSSDPYTFNYERDTQTTFANTRSFTTRPSFGSLLQETTARTTAYLLTRPFREYQNIPNFTTTDTQYSTMEVGGTGTVLATTTIFKQSSYNPGMGIIYNAQTWCGLPAGYWQAGQLGAPAFGIMTALSQRADGQVYRNTLNRVSNLQAMFDKSISVTAYDYFSWENLTVAGDKSSGYYPVITIQAANESLPVINNYITNNPNYIYDWMNSWCRNTDTMEMVTGYYAPMRSLVSATSDLTQFTNQPLRKTSGLMSWGWPYQFQHNGAQGDYWNSPWGVFGAWGNGIVNHPYFVTWRRYFSFSFPELSISGSTLFPRWEWSVDLANDRVTSTDWTSLVIKPSTFVTRAVSAERWPYGAGPGSGSYSGSIEGDPIYPYSMTYGGQIYVYTTATSTYSSVTEPLVKETHTAFVNESTYTYLNTYKIFTDGAVDETLRPVSVITQEEATYHTCNNIGFVTDVPETVTQTLSLYRCGKTNSTATDAPFEVFDEHTYLGLQGGAPYELGNDSVKFFLNYGLVHDDYWLGQNFTVPYSVTDTARISDIWTSYGNTTEAGKPYWSVPVKYTYNGREGDIEWLEFMTKNVGTIMVSDCMKYGTWFPDTTESTDYNGVFSWKTNSAYLGHWSNFTDATWESTDHTYFETYSQTTTTL